MWPPVTPFGASSKDMDRFKKLARSNGRRSTKKTSSGGGDSSYADVVFGHKFFFAIFPSSLTPNLQDNKEGTVPTDK